MVEESYYQRNRERCLANSNRWRAKNPERAKALARQRYLENREEKLAYGREYREKNKQWWRDYCKTYSKTEKYKQYHREWSKRTGQSLKDTARYNSHKHSAVVRNIAFAITKDEFKSFSGSPCFYCGEILDCIRLDRTDNGKGYIMGNVVPCCKVCNYMKKAQNKEDFILRCKAIASRF